MLAADMTAIIKLQVREEANYRESGDSPSRLNFLVVNLTEKSLNIYGELLQFNFTFAWNKLTLASETDLLKGDH